MSPSLCLICIWRWSGNIPNHVQWHLPSPPPVTLTISPFVFSAQALFLPWYQRPCTKLDLLLPCKTLWSNFDGLSSSLTCNHFLLSSLCMLSLSHAQWFSVQHRMLRAYSVPATRYNDEQDTTPTLEDSQFGRSSRKVSNYWIPLGNCSKGIYYPHSTEKQWLIWSL